MKSRRSTSSPHSTCPVCDRHIPADAPEGRCPHCVLSLALQGSSGSGSHAVDTPWDVPSIDELNNQFEDLEFTEVLGVGGMGAVYTARQIRLDRLVAVKVLPPEFGSSPSFVERFQTEAQALARLNHHSIVSIHEFGQQDNLCYYTMEYVDGKDLRRILNRRFLKVRDP